LRENCGIFHVEDTLWINISKRKKQYGVIGHVMEGMFQVGDEIIIRRQDGTELKTDITEIKVFRMPRDEIKVGDNALILLNITDKNVVSRGDKLVK